MSVLCWDTNILELNCVGVAAQIESYEVLRGNEEERSLFVVET